MRRRMYLAELVAEPPAAPKRRRSARRLPPEEEILEEEEEEEEEGGGDEDATTMAVRALEPVALVADDAVFGAAGRRSVVEKNWVPWALNGSLYMSYSLDPHIVLRVPLPPATAAASAAPVGSSLLVSGVAAAVVLALVFSCGSSTRYLNRAGGWEGR